MESGIPPSALLQPQAFRETLYKPKLHLIPPIKSQWIPIKSRMTFTVLTLSLRLAMTLKISQISFLSALVSPNNTRSSWVLNSHYPKGAVHLLLDVFFPQVSTAWSSLVMHALVLNYFLKELFPN